MAKTVGLSRNIKMQWLNKAVALLYDNLEETEYKSALNEYLGYEIGSAINIRKTREILMHLWFYKDAETDDIRELQRILTQFKNILLCSQYLIEFYHRTGFFKTIDGKSQWSK